MNQDDCRVGSSGIGGNSAAICGTCHCFVEVSGDIPAPDPQETAMLGLRPDRADNSRLACQIVVSDGMADITVRLPEFQM